MTETQAAYHVETIKDQEILSALREVLKAGHGKIVITIANYQIVTIEKTISVKVGK